MYISSVEGVLLAIMIVIVAAILLRHRRKR
jgi:flagellin-like protein